MQIGDMIKYWIYYDTGRNGIPFRVTTSSE